MMSNQRTCGDCCLCCKLMSVRELHKPTDEWCPSVSLIQIKKEKTAKVGCTIYETRPESCKVFDCAWLQGALPEEFKPNKIHAVAWLSEDGSTFVIHLDKSYPIIHKTPPIVMMVQNLSKKYKVVLTMGKERFMTCRAEDLSEDLRIRLGVDKEKKAPEL